MGYLPLVINFMKTIIFIGFIVLICLGVFLIIFGGYDDSPGAQGLGLILALVGLWQVFKFTKTQ